MIFAEDIDRMFDSSAPTLYQKYVREQVTDAGRDLAQLIRHLTFDSNEQEVAIRKVREACAFAMMAVPRNRDE